MSKSIQLRLSEQEHSFIKNAFQGENLSQIVRDFLLEEAQKRMADRSDLSLQEDPTVQSFLKLLGSPAVQQTLLELFNKAN